MLTSLAIDILLLCIGLALLIGGGNWLVSEARHLGQILSTPPILIGLTIVALGTSLPEIFLCIQAALSKEPQLALGNVLGSNIANILLVMSVPAILHPISRPLQENHPFLGRDLAVMAGVSTLFFVVCVTDNLNHMVGGILLALVPMHMALLYATTPATALREEHTHGATYITATTTILKLLLAAGLILPLGSFLAIHGSTQLALLLGVPTGIIGLSVLALGTSLPELTVTVVATVRRSADMALGNIIGSNIANILLAAGVAALLIPIPTAFFRFDLWVMGIATLAFIGVVLLKIGLPRAVGGAFLLSYILYIAAVSLRVDPFLPPSYP